MWRHVLTKDLFLYVENTPLNFLNRAKLNCACTCTNLCMYMHKQTCTFHLYRSEHRNKMTTFYVCRNNIGRLASEVHSKDLVDLGEIDTVSCCIAITQNWYGFRGPPEIDGEGVA